MHTLIVGVTESGKTTLGKKLADAHQRAGTGILVLTAVWEKWPADYQTTRPDDFLDNFWKSRGCVAFLDEAGTTVGRFSETMRETATRGRHYGHSCYYLVQRPSLLDTTVRTQCSQLYCFALSLADAEALAEEWLQPELCEAPNLKRGEYFKCLRFGNDGRPSIMRGRVF